MTTKQCRICLEEKPEEEIQELNCRHQFCILCLSAYPGSMCPTRFCVGTRSTDVVVDEMAGMDENGTTQIAFGSNFTVSRIEIEEKQRCDRVRKHHMCVNIARIGLLHCRHRFCYDCLSETISDAVKKKSFAYCPVNRCSNKLTLFEIQSVSLHATGYRNLCVKSLQVIPPCETLPDMSATLQEVFIDCYIYGRESSKKSIILPKKIFINDAVSAVVQLLRIGSNRVISSLDVYSRKDTNEKKHQFKYEKILTDVKCTIKDAGWPDKLTIVVDMEKLITRDKKHK